MMKVRSMNKSERYKVKSEKYKSGGLKKNLSPFTFHFSLHTGFTLIELLTVLAVLGVIGTIVIAVITITLRGTKKSDLLEVGRQNGETALSQIVKSIRYAQTLNDPTSCVGSTTVNAITITSLSDNAQTTYACVNNTIASNSASLIDSNSLTISNCSFVCSQATSGDPPTITITYTLTPKNTSSFFETNFTLPFQTSVTMRNY